MDETYTYARSQLIALVREHQKRQDDRYSPSDVWLAARGTSEFNMWALVVLALKPPRD